MTYPIVCSNNTDPLKLVREGTSQDQRMPEALHPEYALVDGRTTADGIVFAQKYSSLLKYFSSHNMEAGDWQPFFSKDISAQLAMVAIEDVDAYKLYVKSCFNFLNQRENLQNTAQLKINLGYLFNCIATLAQQLDLLKEKLPSETPIKGRLRNLISTQLAPAFNRLVSYYMAGEHSLVASDVDLSKVQILHGHMVSFASVLSSGLSKDWSDNLVWPNYIAGILSDISIYGTPPISMTPKQKVFYRINHIATHNLFKSIFEQFLKVYARVVNEAALALEETLTDKDDHEPHYALFLAFLRLFEYARRDMNMLTGRHLDFYYREILRLKEKFAEPGHAHLLIELAKHAISREFKPDELFKAGKDDAGRDVFYANDAVFVANQARVSALKSIYRHGNEFITSGKPDINRHRFYASPVSNSSDGLGAEFTTPDQSWHPFSNKYYSEGKLAEIRMKKADIGFAIASHYLLMSGGSRSVAIEFKGHNIKHNTNYSAQDIFCQLTGEKGWIDVTVNKFSADSVLRLTIELSGAAPSVTPYVKKIHGFDFLTDLPVLLVKLRNQDTNQYVYHFLQDIVITEIDVTVTVLGLKNLAVSNDFGAVDTSKPFQPFGATPVAGNGLIIGSKEVFQKSLDSASVNLRWLVEPVTYNTAPRIRYEFLSESKWKKIEKSFIKQERKSKLLEKHNLREDQLDILIANGNSISDTEFFFMDGLNSSVDDEPDFGKNEFYNVNSRHGFVKMVLTDGFGHAAYQTALIKYLVTKVTTDNPGVPPVSPSIGEISLTYVAKTNLMLDASSTDAYEKRQGRFFHLAPFGQAEQHPTLIPDGKISLLPQFDFQSGSDIDSTDAAEFYIGMTGLRPPQNLALLFQVADGTADPLATKPELHIRWSYLTGNVWHDFGKNDVQDNTDELLNSGIITFAMPRDISDNNSILPSGLFWIRAAVSEKSDAVCGLKLVAAQALQTTYVDKGNSSNFSANSLESGTISKLHQPDALIKSIAQPFSSFGGRRAELPKAFYTRISERLRHKDRSIALWDYERLVLEEFPQVYKVKCLNHTHYEPGKGIYRELAPGHITIVTIPNLQLKNLHDPLKPYSSLGLLSQIEEFLQKRLSCFAKLHVMNPIFEEVRVKFKLNLKSGFDETYSINQLKLAITRFLSPWAFSDGGTPSFGGKIYKSVLINFIEDQPCVDYINDFELFHRVNINSPEIDAEEIEGSSAVSILVSAPASSHDIVPVKFVERSAPGINCSCES